jgi:phenylacetate-coenzyme A ligase PaaK-like adenylate-forming protein
LTLLSSIGQNDIKSIIDEGKEPKWLSEIRENAFSKYLNLPSEVSPLYKKYSDDNRLKPEHIYLPDRTKKSEQNGDIRG